MENSEQNPVVEPLLPASDLSLEVLALPCQLRIELRIPDFKVRDLLALEVDSIVDSRRKEGLHMPVSVNGEMIAWAEFDVVEEQLAVRLTEIV